MNGELDDWVEIHKDSVHVARERQKARELKKSAWWQNQLNRGICHYCGKKFPASELTMDHLIPVARGGKSTKGNIVPACRNCNATKKYLTPAEIILKQLEDEEKEKHPELSASSGKAADPHENNIAGQSEEK